jgi:hypothetical protein
LDGAFKNELLRLGKVLGHLEPFSSAASLKFTGDEKQDI